jgi:hypothetical protein
MVKRRFKIKEDSMTFEDLKCVLKAHQELSSVRELLKSGEFELDVWGAGSTENSGTIKVMIRSKDKMSVEMTKLPFRLLKYLCKSAHSIGAELVKASHERSRQSVLRKCGEYVKNNPEMQERVKQLLEEL